MKFIYRVHAIERMFQRDISDDEVEYVVKNGRIIEKYYDDKPYPSFLIYASVNNKKLHIVYAKDENESVIIITVYQPSLDFWKDDYMTRKAK